ncbi:MAG: bifunctional transaldolase/phosoglucose isomerase [Anaerolineales bacterium]
MNPIPRLLSLGQSLWYDNIHRQMLENGELKALIHRGDIRGVTSNPSIFLNAIAQSNAYDSALIPLAWAGWDAESIFWQLAVEDIQDACDLFAPLYEETNGGDGYVSLEVSPALAYDSEATLEQAEALWKRVNRPNLMIKIPATPQGIPAVRQAIAKGINVNVTLIFSLARYDQVMEAYLSGLEDRVRAGLPLDRIASVASFFISRVDTKVDALLHERPYLRGQAAIANARLAYAAFTKTFDGPRWQALKARGAQLQRPLWASTSAKNPDYPDVVYVNTLIGPHTVNTVPPKTLQAYRDHGMAYESVTQQMDKVRAVMFSLEEAGISMEKVTQELEDEGVKAFADAFTALLAAIETRRTEAASQLGPLAAPVSRRIAQLEADSVSPRLWDADASLWTTDPDGQAEVQKRLGWLRLPETSRSSLPEWGEFADQVHYEGVQRILLLGMGGSSLAPEVMSNLFVSPTPEAAEGKPCLAILDSTDPAQVAWAAQGYPPQASLYLVSSKSGGTAEVNAALDYFWELSGGDSSRFIAITDPGTALEKLAHERRFRQVFLADPNVGGRYSALSAFGLVPAALLGVDLKRLLGRAAWMMAQCRPEVAAARNPGLVLGAVLGEAALHGRDKLTLLADPPLASLGSWLEQLVAESSGKEGKGILPVDGESPGDPALYRKDRLFVYLRQSGDLDEQITALRAAGHPALVMNIENAYDLGAECYRWEFATAVACHILGVNAFDQPNVEDAKQRARERIVAFQKDGRLPEGEFVPLSKAKSALKQFLAQAKDGDYVAILAYLPRNQEMTAALRSLQAALRDKTRCAVTVGFGPRYLHSTGQLHKGGPDTGLFLLLTAEPQQDIEIPPRQAEAQKKKKKDTHPEPAKTHPMTFGALERAQALGDYEALQAAGRRLLRVHLPRPDAAGTLTEKLLAPAPKR